MANTFQPTSRDREGALPDSSRTGRRAFTIVEAMVALALILILGIIVTQAVVWGLQERMKAKAHHAAIELAANVLEAARAEPIDKLDKAWADAQQVPSDMEIVLPDAKLAVTVEPEPKLPTARRVSVEVRWQFVPQPAKSVHLTTIISARAAKKGGTP